MPRSISPAKPASPPTEMCTLERVLRHDLPNQIMVTEGLLSLFEEDERHQLSETGRQYIQRLANGLRKARRLAEYTREMTRLESHDVRIEEIQLGLFARELKATLVSDLPDRSLDFHWDWSVPTVHCDYGLLMKAARGLLFPHLQHRPMRHCTIEGHSHRRDEGTAVIMTWNAGMSPRIEEANLECSLAERLANKWGGSFEWQPNPEGSERFTLWIPDFHG